MGVYREFEIEKLSRSFIRLLFSDKELFSKIIIRKGWTDGEGEMEGEVVGIVVVS